MNTKQAVPFYLAAIVLACPSANASYSPRIHSAPQHKIVLRLSDLRSAFLLRDGVVRYDESNMTAAGLRRQLQRHFDVVMDLLIVSTPQSLETAVARLEANDGHEWSSDERAAWRQRLLEQRHVQMLRLAAYRDRGQFPLNEGQSELAVPIFVDRHDTACAVGQLMRWSSWTDEVASIRRLNNSVYVPDAPQSALASWVLTSGLTIEEAALIQPGYTPAAPYLISDHEPGEPAFIQGDMKYENFQLSAQNFTVSGPVPFHQAIDICGGCLFMPTAGGSLPVAANVGFNAGSELFFGNLEALDPVGNRWLSIGGAGSLFGSPPFRLIGGQSQPNTIQRIVISFDASTIGANNFFNQFAEHSYPTYAGFGPIFSVSNQGQYEMTSEARSLDGTLLATTYFDETPLPQPGQPDFTRKSSAGSFNPISTIRGTSTLWLYNGATVDSVVLGFQVVPEPSLCFFGVSALAYGCGTRFRRRKCTALVCGYTPSDFAVASQ